MKLSFGIWQEFRTAGHLLFFDTVLDSFAICCPLSNVTAYWGYARTGTVFYKKRVVINLMEVINLVFFSGYAGIWDNCFVNHVNASLSKMFCANNSARTLQRKANVILWFVTVGESNLYFWIRFRKAWAHLCYKSKNEACSALCFPWFSDKDECPFCLVSCPYHLPVFTVP